jgi:hypothetical protein
MAKAALILTAFLAIFLIKVEAGMDFDWDYFRDFLGKRPFLSQCVT